MSNKELEIVIDTITAADRRFTYNETLTLENVLEPEVISAYFAEKTVKKESLKDGTYQYTFDKETSTDSKTKRSNVAKAIHKSINDELSSQHKEVKLKDITKVINEKETGKKWPLQSHAKDSTLTFDQYKNETKIYYKKIPSAPMGYQVYLITETKNLKDKKVKIKIHEKEEKDKDDKNKSVFKILKTKDDTLPVKVFAKKEDTTTDTEVSDWIEIEVKEENGNKDGDDLFLYKEENENKIEVGIKKIQLRPKEDKIKTEGEDAHKSFEGWQEALYIREDETDDGKKAIEDAKALKTTRDADKSSTILTFDENAAKKSFPKKISGPENIDILGKDAVFTIDEYKSTATTEDKNNIRWCIYVDEKSTVIKDKSKAGFYTYAKSELVDVLETTAADGTVTKTGGTNKLTIVFDKALEGKTIQIEPYRGAPDHKVSKGWVYENTVKGNKITKRETTSLWITTQCESVKSPGTMVGKDFENYFKLKYNSTIYIYSDGKISETYLKNGDKVTYVYVEVNGTEHKLGTTKVISTRRHTKMNVLSNTNGDDIKLVYAKDIPFYNSGNVKFKFLTWNSSSGRWYINPFCLAGLIGAMIEENIEDLGFNGFSIKNGNTAGGSTSHINGEKGDLRYLSKNVKTAETTHLQHSHFDYDRQVKFNNALYKFGWGKISKNYSEKFTYNGKETLLPHTKHKKKIGVYRHHHHLHLTGFKLNNY